MGCTEKGVIWQMGTFETVPIHLATPPDTYPPIFSTAGQLKVGAAASGRRDCRCGWRSGVGGLAALPQQHGSGRDANCGRPRARGKSENAHREASRQERGLTCPSLGDNSSLASPRREFRPPWPSPSAPMCCSAGEHIPVPNAAVGLLYDASVCIGCKACVAACAEANDTPPDTRGDQLHQAPSDLNDLTRNVIKLYKPEDGSAFSFVKRQCMHCLDPACAAGCPFQALHKDPESGIVSGTPTSALAAATAPLRARITFRVSSGWDSIRA